MSRPRLLDTATARENHERFVRRAIEQETTWTIWGDTGPLIAESNGDEDEDEDDEVEPREVFLFFSDKAYAARALRESWPESPAYAPREVTLFNFMYRWLPGIHRDGHLVGANWTGDLIGLEVEPAELLEELKATLPEEVRARHLAELEAAK